MAKSCKSIAYVLNSFPHPSETFISGEAASMLDVGVSPHVLAINKGNFSVIHPSAQKLLDGNLVNYKKESSLTKSLFCAVQLVLKKPRTALLCLVKRSFSSDRWLYFQCAPLALDFLNKRVDYIHAHFAAGNLRWAMAISEWVGIPYGVTTHGFDLRKNPISVGAAKKLFENAEIIVSVNEYNCDLMVQKFDIPRDRISVIHCGVDLDVFSKADSATKFRHKTLRMVNVGRLVPEKGQDVLLRALGVAKEQGVRFELKIVGSGHLYESLTALCTSLQLDDCVTFEGAKPQSRVVELLQESDVFILPSRVESLPVSIMEAMASGLLVISTNISGIPELIDDKANGLLVEPEEVDELSASIIWIDQNRSRAEKMSRSARLKVVEEFSRKKCTESLLKCIRSIL